MTKTSGCLCLFFLFSLHLAGQTCLEGNCYTGRGTMLYASGARYSGDFRQGQLRGKGTLLFTDGRKYIGEWQDNYRHGKGKLIYPSGEYYEGTFRRNRPHGEGSFHFESGEVYRGQFVQGRLEGYGRRTYSDGSYYEGGWANGLRHGEGKLVFADGQQLTGRWINDQYYAPDSPTHPASVDLRDCNAVFCADGQGKYTYKSGVRYFGDFLQGRPEGKGNAYFPNGDRYTGGWKNDQPHGKGEKHFASGKILGAIWDFGQPAKVLYNYAGGAVQGPAAPESRQPTTQASGEVKVWAVIVGAARYAHLPALRYTDDDAYQLFAFLKSPEGGALPDRQVRLLIDEQATRHNILESMDLLFSQAGPNDVILFYFSGHGIEGAFLPVDFDGYNNRVFHREINEQLKASAARHKLLLADACHSGSLPLARNGVQVLLERYYGAFRKASSSTALLLSSRGEEYSLEDSGLRSGIFSHFMIRGMKGAADRDGDHIVTIRELFDYVHQEVRRYTGNEQTPTLVGQFDEQMPVAVVR